MFSVTWFDTRGVLRNICTPSEDTAEALFDSLRLFNGRMHMPRLWHHPAKGEVTLLAPRMPVVKRVKKVAQ